MATAAVCEDRREGVWAMLDVCSTPATRCTLGKVHGVLGCSACVCVCVCVCVCGAGGAEPRIFSCV